MSIWLQKSASIQPRTAYFCTLVLLCSLPNPRHVFCALVVGGRLVSASFPCRSVAFQFCTLVLLCCLPNHSHIFWVLVVEGRLVSASVPCRSVAFLFQSRLFFLFSHVSPRPSFSFSFRLGCVHGRNFSLPWKTGGTPDIFSHEDSSDLPPPPPKSSTLKLAKS